MPKESKRARKLIVANWKMHKTVSEAVRCATHIKQALSGKQEHEIVLCAPFTSLYSMEVVLQQSCVFLGAQNAHFEHSGAHTGEVSLRMLQDLACEFVILGHSERRQFAMESNGLLNKKLRACLSYRMSAILCLGDSLEQYDGKTSLPHIAMQLEEGLRNIDTSYAHLVNIAYEPIWAIGTGRTADSLWLEDTHGFIREKLMKLLGKDVAKKVRIIYGGSVKRDNVAALTSVENVDGVLVGGASLDPDHFVDIVKFA